MNHSHSHMPTKTVLVAIPALNEEKTIRDVVSRIPTTLQGVSRVSIVVIDDGSTDNTAPLARGVGADVVSHDKNRGVGAAFQTAIAEARARGVDILVQMDGDGQFNPEDIVKLIEPVLKETTDIAMCTRFSVRKKYPKMPGIKIWGNHVVRYIVNFTTNSSFTDVSNGFRAYGREAILRLTPFGNFTYTHEVLLDAASKRLRTVEVPLEVRGERQYGTSRVAKSVLVYAIQWLSIFFRALRDLMPFQVFGVFAAVIGAAGAASGGFVFFYWLSTGHTSPYRSLITLSVLLIILAAFFLMVALLADMLRSQRVISEELLYHARKEVFKKKNGTHLSDKMANQQSGAAGIKTE